VNVVYLTSVIVLSCDLSSFCHWFQLVSVGYDGRILVWQLNQHQKQLRLVDGFVTVNLNLVAVSIRQNHSSGSDSAYSHTFLHSLVCLSVVCHTRVPCLNRSTDLHAIVQVRMYGPRTHCVRWGSLTRQGKEKVWGLNPQPIRAIADCCCHLAHRNEELH